MKRYSAEERAERFLQIAEALGEYEEILAQGYQVKKFTPWHWRISRWPDWKLEVDVWPTSKKLMNREKWHVTRYTHLLKKIEEIFMSEEYMP